MKHYKLLFILIVNTIYVSHAQSQLRTQTLRGTILDKQSKYPLTGATIVLINSSPLLGTTSDENGEYRLGGVPIGRHSIKITYLGYSEAVINDLLVSQGKEAVLNVELEENIVTADEVEVTAQTDKTQSLNEMATVSSRQFTVDETQRYAGSLNDPSRMAANYAGVSGANDSRNDIIIRGNSPTGLLWRMDGLPIPNPNHFGSLGSTGGPVSILNNNLLANSDFMTGAFPAEYGNAISGVFDLKLRAGNNKKREYLGQVGFNGFELGAEGPFSKKSRASYLINYRYSTLGVFKALGINIGTGQAVPQYQDLSVKIDLPTAKAGRFSLFAIGGDSYIEFLDSKRDTTKKNENLYTNDGYDTYFGSKMGVVGFNHTYFFNRTTSSLIGVATSGLTNTIRQDSVDLKILKPYDDYRGDRKETRITTTLQLNKKISTKNTLQLGTYIHRIGFNYNERLFDESINTWRRLTFSEGNSILSEIFAQWKHRFNDKLSINGGLHAQHFAYSSSTALEPRAGIKWQFLPKQSINLGVGIHNQLQPMAVYFNQTRLADGSYLQTNRNLGFTRSSQIVLGYDNAFASKWRIKSEVYYQAIDKVPVEKRPSYFSMLNAGADFGNPDNDSLENKGTGYNYGLELTLEKFLSNGFYLLSTASLFESRYTGSDGIERNTAFNGNYVYNILAGKEFKIGNKLTLAVDGKITVAGGKRYVPIDLNRSIAENKAVFATSEAFNDRLPSYFRPDIKVTIRHEARKFTQEFSINVQNVTNNQNVFSRNYSRTEQKIVTINQLGLFPVPQYRILF